MIARPILCLDFDGVIHSYASGWKGADVVADPPTPGAMKWMAEAIHIFDIHIFSSRSNQPGGLDAMRTWLRRHAARDCPGIDPAWVDYIVWPIEKPPAMITIDDRALTFTGNWDDFNLDRLLMFKPWNKQ